MPRILIAGDLFPTSANMEYFIAGDTEAIFGERILSLFRAADCAVCNLEGSLCNEDTQVIAKDGASVRAPVESIKGIGRLGIQCVTLANNHTTDYGPEGYRQTRDALAKENISFFGAGENADSIVTHIVREIGGVRVALYGVSETVFNIPGNDKPGANLYDEYRVCRELTELKRTCDCVVVLYHGGMEHLDYPTDAIRRRFHRMADSGADVVLAQHTHCMVAEECYSGSYLLYGQGNFCFNYRSKPNRWNQQGLLIELDVSEGGFRVIKHIVKRTPVGAAYDAEQDFSAFNERSRRVEDRAYCEEAFSAFADERIIPYLQAFRGKNLKDRIARKILGKNAFRGYLMKQFSREQLLRILKVLRTEEFGAIAQRGIEDILDRRA